MSERNRIENERVGGSLDDRRPRTLGLVVGNRHVKQRLVHQMSGGKVPPLTFLYGPTGSGKTTVAHILARHFFCQNRRGLGDPCGACRNCRLPLDSIAEFDEWSGTEVEDAWDTWWVKNGRSMLNRRGSLFFLDETQDMSPRRQKGFLKQLESATTTVIFATTHKNQIDDALLGRFGANVYEMTRPTPEEVADHMAGLSAEFGLAASRDLLLCVAEAYGLDLRRCVDFVHTAREQLPGKALTAGFVEMVVGPRPTGGHAGATNQRRLPKL